MLWGTNILGSVVDPERFIPDPDPTSYLILLSFLNKKFCTEIFEELERKNSTVLRNPDPDWIRIQEGKNDTKRLLHFWFEGSK
jgi:hypothetical protein